MRTSLLLPFTLLFLAPLCAQPDSLYVSEHGGAVAYAVRYPPLKTVESFTHEGRYAMDT